MAYVEATKEEFEEANRLYRHMWNYQNAREDADSFDLPANPKFYKTSIQQGKHTYAVDIDLLEKTYKEFTIFLESKGLKTDFEEMRKSGDFSYSKPITPQEIKKPSQYQSQEQSNKSSETTTNEMMDIIEKAKSFGGKIDIDNWKHIRILSDDGNELAFVEGGFDDTNSPKSFNIRNLYVDESLRGKGIASFLMDIIEKKAIENGIDEITLSASGEGDLISFYKKLGYELNGKNSGTMAKKVNAKKEILQNDTTTKNTSESSTVADSLSALMSTTPQELIDEGLTKSEYVKLDDQKAQAKFNWVSNYMNSYSQVDNRTLDQNGNTNPDEIKFYENQVIEMIKQNRGTFQATTMLEGKKTQNDSGELETHYSMKQIGEMGELLKAAQRLKEKTGEDYLSAFSSVGYVDDYLRKIKADKSGDFASMLLEAKQKNNN